MVDPETRERHGKQRDDREQAPEAESGFLHRVDSTRAEMAGSDANSEDFSHGRREELASGFFSCAGG